MLTARNFVVGSTLLLVATAQGANTGKTTATYAKDVAPILFKNCAACHRPGEGAPMSLLDYKSTRPWAKSIKQAVVSKAMPPWLADPKFGHFANDRRLKQTEIDTIANWVDAGAPQGNVADMPVTPKFVEGWQLGKPDMVIEMPTTFEVPAQGVIPYKYFSVPTGFTEDKWVRGVEIRAGSPSVVHHIIVTLSESGTTGDVRRPGATQLAGTAPGLQATAYPDGVARLIKAGSSMIFQMHYTTNGKATPDKSYVGLYFSKEPARVISKSASIMNFRFAIPPGDPNYEVTSTWTAKEDIVLTGFMPHMHVRGKDFKYTVVYPDGREEILLNVPRYDFNWQLGYKLQDPMHLPKGTRIDCVAHYDNSENNKFNPDPTKEVKWGDQTFEEMMIGFFDYQLPAQALKASAEPRQ